MDNASDPFLSATLDSPAQCRAAARRPGWRDAVAARLAAPAPRGTWLRMLAFVLRRRMFLHWLRRNRDRLRLIDIDGRNLSQRGRRGQRAIRHELAERLRGLTATRTRTP